MTGCIVENHANGTQMRLLNDEHYNKVELDLKNTWISDGSVVKWPNGSKEWWVNGKRHREDGPAFETPSGYNEWWVNGKRHREDGPALETPSGYNEWWVNGNEYSEQEFATKTKPAKELTLAEIEKLLGYPVKVVG